MKLRILYFILGGIFVFAMGCIFVLWDSYHDYRAEKYAVEEAGHFSPPNLVLSEKDLTGTWRGKESLGIKYVITRNGDGTFSEVEDLRGGDAYDSKGPSFVKSKGRWSLLGRVYGFYYTESTDPSMVGRGPWTSIIYPYSKAEFNYIIEEGDGIVEDKE